MADLGRIRHAAGLDDDVVNLTPALADTVEGQHEAVGQRAADAAAGQVDRLAVVAGDEVGVDIDVAKIVDQHSQAEALAVAKQVVEQRRLAGTEIAADDGIGNGIRHTCHAAAARL